ncbi:MAG: amidohydrolase family protein [Thermoanaerobaculales bacterium]|nr:amidohydrolase family protein [Thermoanaerobaculales bacterium]
MRTRFVNLRIPNSGNDTTQAEILVVDGLIEEVIEAGTHTAVGEEEWVDLEDALVLPGMIDGGVDLADPGYPLRGDFSSGTTAAAVGGVTCVVDLPHSSNPPVTNIKALELKGRIASTKAHVDFMHWGGISDNVWREGAWQEHLYAMADAGIAGLFVTMRSELADFQELDFEQLATVLQEAWRIGIPVGIHAEVPDLIHRNIREARSRGEDGAAAWSAAHPSESEYSAVAVVREICRTTGVRLHFLAVGSGEALDLVLEGQQEGIPISADTSPTRLEFSAADFEGTNSILKLMPALKESSNKSRLWQGLRDGSIEMMSSGHVASQWPEEKQTKSIWTDRAGSPDLELTLPYLYSEGVCTGRISLERLVELTAAAPARFFGIDHLKGGITPGLHADFVVFDDNQTWTIHNSEIHGINRFTPFEGRRLTGRIRATYLRGACVFRRTPDGREMFGPAGAGRWIKRG